MVPWVIALVALAEEPGSVLITHQTAPNYLLTPVSGDLKPSSGLHRHEAHM